MLEYTRNISYRHNNSIDMTLNEKRSVSYFPSHKIIYGYGQFGFIVQYHCYHNDCLILRIEDGFLGLSNKKITSLYHILIKLKKYRK